MNARMLQLQYHRLTDEPLLARQQVSAVHTMWTSTSALSVYQFIEHEPAPRGSPQLPQGATGISRLVEVAPLLTAAKTESCFSSFLL